MSIVFHNPPLVFFRHRSAFRAVLGSRRRCLLVACVYSSSSHHCSMTIYRFLAGAARLCKEKISVDSKPGLLSGWLMRVLDVSLFMMINCQTARWETTKQGPHQPPLPQFLTTTCWLASNLLLAVKYPIQIFISNAFNATTFASLNFKIETKKEDQDDLLLQLIFGRPCLLLSTASAGT